MAVILLLCSGRHIAAASGDPAYLDALQQQAAAQHLADDTAWLRLLHYEPRRLRSGWTSAITDAHFFVAADGRDHPQAELAATLALFFSDTPRDDEPTQCRFRARYHWLKRKLALDAARLPEQDCARFDAWREGLNVQRLALVFASADLSAPSTLFGHTLLRLDARGQDHSDRLLAYAINYAAVTGAQSGPLYALRGLSGGYDGYFGLFPYYEKVKEYVRIEYRDLWEYPLQLSQDDTDRLLEHLWELRGIGIRYYFLSRNCSYQLLAALEAIRPDLALTPRFRALPPYAIPLDTVRELSQLGQLQAPEYRPSLARQLQARYQQLPSALQQWTLAYADGRATLGDTRLRGADPADAALALELAHELLFFRFNDDQLTREQGLPLARAALLARSQIPVPSTAASPSQPAQSPEQSHASGRFGVALRRVDEDHYKTIVGLRPAYHDRLDPANGYIAAGEIEALAMDLRIDRDAVQLDHASILHIEAVAPRDALFKPWSWSIDTGLRRRLPLAASPGALGAYLDGGRGLAWSLGRQLQAYGLAAASLDVNQDLPRGQDAAAGLRLGLAGQFADELSIDLRGDWLLGLGPDARDRQSAMFGVQRSWHARQGLRLRWRLEREELRGHHEQSQAIEAGWLLYF